MSDYADLIRRLRDAAPKANNFGLKFYGDHMREAADAITVLLKDWQERRIWCENVYQRGLRNGERIGLEKAAEEAASGWESATAAARAIRALITKEQSDEMKKHEAYFTHSDEAGHLYYFAPANRANPPYKKQRTVRAIIDIADDGTLAGVELIDDMPPPPKELK